MNSTENDIRLDDLKTDKYLIYLLDDEKYATPLLSIREVVQQSEIRPIPLSADYFLGVMNLRGTIISVIDLKTKFQMTSNLSNNVKEKKYIMILDLGTSSIGIRVDKIDSVKNLISDEITYAPKVDSNINPKFLIGTTRIDNELVTIIELDKLILEEDIQ